VAALFEAVGADVVVTLEVHNPAAFENAFRCRTVALTATPVLVEYAKHLAGEKLCVISPDTGGAKRAELFRETLQMVSGREIATGLIAAPGSFRAISLSVTWRAPPPSSSTI